MWEAVGLMSNVIETGISLDLGLRIRAPSLKNSFLASSLSPLSSRDCAISRCRVGSSGPVNFGKWAADVHAQNLSRNDQSRAAVNDRLATFYRIPSLEIEKPKSEWEEAAVPHKVSSEREKLSSKPSSSSPKTFTKSSTRSSAKKITLPRGNLFLQGEDAVNQPDHLIDLEAILEALRETGTLEQMQNVMAEWKGRLSFRLMMSLLKQERDWQRALALHDWMLEEGGYKPSIFGYNIVIRNVLKARRWTLGEGLVSEMIEKGVSPDKYTYSSLISSFGKAGKFDSAIMWLQRMEEKGVPPDLVTYSTLIELAGKVKNFSKAVSLFTKMRAAGKPQTLILFFDQFNSYVLV